jgi:hypothetical protein
VPLSVATLALRLSSIDFASDALDEAEDTNVSPATASKAETIKNLESVAVDAARLNSCPQE